MTPTEKLAIIIELLGKVEHCICDRCGNKHIDERDALITVEQAHELLNKLGE